MSSVFNDRERFYLGHELAQLVDNHKLTITISDRMAIIVVRDQEFVAVGDQAGYRVPLAMLQALSGGRPER